MGKKVTPTKRKIKYIDPNGKAKKRKLPKVVKAKCCEKYKKGEKKRCSKCPCFDLMQQVA